MLAGGSAPPTWVGPPTAGEREHGDGRIESSAARDRGTSALGNARRDHCWSGAARVLDRRHRSCQSRCTSSTSSDATSSFPGSAASSRHGTRGP